MMAIDIAKKHLKVGLKGQPLIIDRPLMNEVKKSDSIWCLETDGNGDKVLQISLTKKSECWWECAFVGDQAIDVETLPQADINSAADLETLPAEERKFVEKMMHRERQRIKGEQDLKASEGINELQVPQN